MLDRVDRARQRWPRHVGGAQGTRGGRRERQSCRSFRSHAAPLEKRGDSETVKILGPRAPAGGRAGQRKPIAAADQGPAGESANSGPVPASGKSWPAPAATARNAFRLPPSALPRGTSPRVHALPLTVSTNCGRNAVKNSMVFGLVMATRNPLKRKRGDAAPAFQAFCPHASRPGRRARPEIGKVLIQRRIPRVPADVFNPEFRPNGTQASRRRRPTSSRNCHSARRDSWARSGLRSTSAMIGRETITSTKVMSR